MTLTLVSLIQGEVLVYNQTENLTHRSCNLLVRVFRILTKSKISYGDKHLRYIANQVLRKTLPDFKNQARSVKHWG